MSDAIKKAVCPYCKTEMIGVYYENEEGDWFICWMCNCAEIIKLENKLNKKVSTNY